KLAQAGVSRGTSSLFILEGVLMYLKPASVAATMQTISDFAAKSSRVVFDYVHACVLKGEGRFYGEEQINQMVSDAGERWHSGIEEDGVESFLARFGLSLIEHKQAADMERDYFTDSQGKRMARINGAHALVTAIK
ncbi:MAG: hypothetical protein EHM66_00765, partial [Deltaproteobacteria bacterium]